MPRRELLTATQRGQLLALPDEAGDLIRLFTLSNEDLAFVRQHRGAHNGEWNKSGADHQALGSCLATARV
jgi:hypothetical protein